MYLKLLDLNDQKQNYDFNLSLIPEQTWKYFICDVVMINCGDRKGIQNIEASVTIRDNKAKTQIAYQNDKYHEILLNLTPTGEVVGKHSEKLTHSWFSTLLPIYGEALVEAISNKGMEI